MRMLLNNSCTAVFLLTKRGWPLPATDHICYKRQSLDLFKARGYFHCKLKTLRWIYLFTYKAITWAINLEVSRQPFSPIRRILNRGHVKVYTYISMSSLINLNTCKQPLLKNKKKKKKERKEEMKVQSRRKCWIVCPLSMGIISGL